MLKNIYLTLRPFAMLAIATPAIHAFRCTKFFIQDASLVESSFVAVILVTLLTLAMDPA